MVRAVPSTPSKPRCAAARRRQLAGLAFVAPWLLGLGGFMLYPIAASLYYSFCEYSVLQSPQWIGPGNYADLFTDELFWKALSNTLRFAMWSLPLGVGLSFAVAALLNTGVRGLAAFRTFFFLPALVPLVALAVLWLWIFNGEYGVLNQAVEQLDRWLTYALDWPHPLLKGPGWLSDPVWALSALVIMSLWGVGNAMVIYLAALQEVPTHLYEAAELDGAGWVQKVRHVAIPSVSPVILFNLIMGIIGTLQYFAVPYVISPEGSPARSIYFLTMYLYDNAFTYLRMGYACAMAWILFIIIFVLTLLALRVSRRFVYYEGE